MPGNCQPIVAVDFITETNLKAIGNNLERIYPIEGSPCFQELLSELYRAEQRLMARQRLDGVGK